MLYLFTILCGGGLLVLVGYLFAPVSARRFARARARPLLTPNEKEFYGRIRRALPEFTVWAQVSMGALLTAPEGGRDAAGWGFRERFNRKVVDFVVLDAQLRVLALVELDDRTHNPVKDAARDRLMREAGYVTLRYESRAKPAEATLRQDVLALAP